MEMRFKDYSSSGIGMPYSSIFIFLIISLTLIDKIIVNFS